jgi:hypothetical protein
MGKINGKVLSLLRIKASKCLISGRLHEQENAYIIINKGDYDYSVNFGCYRKCFDKKIIYIGSITIDNLLIMINPNYEPAPATRKKQKEKYNSK